MKKLLLMVAEKIAVPLCLLVVLTATFADYLNSLFLGPLTRYGLMIGVLVVWIASMIKLANKSLCFRQVKSINAFIYMNYLAIAETLFSWYLFLYTILRFYRISIVCTYVLLFMLGIYYGCRLMNNALNESKQEMNSKIRKG